MSSNQAIGLRGGQTALKCCKALYLIAQHTAISGHSIRPPVTLLYHCRLYDFV